MVVSCNDNLYMTSIGTAGRHYAIIVIARVRATTFPYSDYLRHNELITQSETPIEPMQLPQSYPGIESSRDVTRAEQPSNVVETQVETGECRTRCIVVDIMHRFGK